ncbi:methyl-accepting chemotaxis protein [Achromobacter sp. F4_2707]|uniref:methyl-accepting chemotaxis protein n=1 Tax=Achromobacter sp. F4_2707 TaxID=3114286 RepID=UPI0039C70B9A
MQAFLNRLPIAQKYAIIGILVVLVTLIPTSMVVYDKVVSARQASAAAEYLEPATQVLEIIRLSQQARGLSNAFLNGNDGASANLNNALNALQAAHDQAEAQMAAAGVEKQTIDQLRDLRGQINSLADRARAKNIAAGESFSSYTGIIARQMAVLADIVSVTGLDLDSSPDTYPLINGLFSSLPPLTEYLGQARGFSSGLLARGNASMADLQRTAALNALSQDRLQAWDATLATAMRNSPFIQTELAASVSQASSSTRDALALTQREVIAAETLSYPSSNYFSAMTTPIDAQFGLARQVADVLDTLLQERADNARNQLLLLLGGLTVLAIIAFWLAVLLTKSAIVSLRTSLNMARTVASGDLTTVAPINGTDESQQLLQALNNMTGSLVGIVTQVRGATDNIAAAAAQIASGNNDLSERTVSQAAALEETAASMEQLTSTVTQNSDNATTANVLTRDATEVARRGGQAVEQFVTTMGAIRETSSHITEIVGIIDGIAFQTNILALNAAVEAARAGEAGKGFAVVASEVRSLAQRSANSAREIRDLINQSAEEVNAGSELADAAGQTMREVLQSIEQVGQIMNEIAVASQEQSSGIAQVNLAVGQMDDATQQNAALVQQAASAAAALREQAELLVQAVSTFQLPGQAQTQEREYHHSAPMLPSSRRG